MPHSHLQCTPRLFVACLCLGLLPHSQQLAWATPNIARISQPGAKIGSSVKLTISGSELSADAQILVGFPIQSAHVIADKTEQNLQVEMIVAGSAQPGCYPLRIVTARGVSNAKLFAIDALDHRPIGDEVVSLPVAVYGNLTATQRRDIRFQGTRGQRLVADVEAKRIGSNVNCVLRLLDEQRRQIAYANAQPWWGGDARLIAVLPHDGLFTLELHDQLYRAGNPNLFRLKLGDLAVADRAFPAAVVANTTTKFSFLGGMMSPEQTTEFIAAPDRFGWQALPWPTMPFTTGSQPAVWVSDHAEFVELRQDHQPQELTAAPVGVSGVLRSPGESDVYTIPVQPNQKLRVELIARRLGSPLDGLLSIRNEQGQPLANADDSPDSRDAMIDNFTVPAKVQKIQLVVSDLLKRGHADLNYRLVVTPQEAADFSLSIAEDTLSVPTGGTQIYKVAVVRRNFNGPIQLSLAGLPAEVQVQGAEISADSNFGLLVLTMPNTKPATWFGFTSLTGRGGDRVRVAESSAIAAPSSMPYLRSDLAWSITNPLPIQIVWQPGMESMIQGQPSTGKIEVIRQPNTPGAVRLKLITNQPVVNKKIKVNNQDKEVFDAARNLRLLNEVTLQPEQATADVALFVPGNLPQRAWDAVLAAELLSPDGKQVVATATAYSTVKRFDVKPALRIELTSEPIADGLTGAGTTGKFSGKVIRSPGYVQPVVVTLRGLPAGYGAPLVEIPAHQETFELPLNFPFSNKPTELKNIKLVAVADRHEPAAAASNEISVSVKLQQGQKPTPEKPVEIFEDAETFVASLVEGTGKAALDTDKHSGQYAIRVTPDQKFAVQIPNFQFKIREHPAPGEYRYLRYAWRKKGGNTICLQLAHDGQFGPGGSGREGAKFRYHAGPAGEQFGGSVGLDNKIPGQYQVVVRDLFADFGEFTLTGLALSPVDGQAAFFDGIYLGRNQEDFELIGK